MGIFSVHILDVNRRDMGIPCLVQLFHMDPERDLVHPAMDLLRILSAREVIKRVVRETMRVAWYSGIYFNNVYLFRRKPFNEKFALSVKSKEQVVYIL